MDEAVVLDNGAYEIKYCHKDKQGRARNAVAYSKPAKRTFVGPELTLDCADYGSLVFQIPFERGVLTQWNVQRQVWDLLLGSERFLGIKSPVPLLVTIPPLLPPQLPPSYLTLLFSPSYASVVSHVCLVPAPVLASFALAESSPEPAPELCVILDVGFSAVTCTPVARHRVVRPAVRRTTLGGKHLVNWLKEIVSFKQFYMMDQTTVVDKCLRETAFVSTNWQRDEREALVPPKRSRLLKEYVLPDFVPTSANKLGYVVAGANEGRSHSDDETSASEVDEDGPPPPKRPRRKQVRTEPPPPPPTTTTDAEASTSAAAVAPAPAAPTSVLQMTSDRFTVPEVLFRPSLLGLTNEPGLAHLVAQSIEALPKDVQGLAWANVVLTGGCANLPGLRKRLTRELRELAPIGHVVRVRIVSDKPEGTAQLGARALFSSSASERGRAIRDSYFTLAKKLGPRDVKLAGAAAASAARGKSSKGKAAAVSRMTSSPRGGGRASDSDEDDDEDDTEPASGGVSAMELDSGGVASSSAAAVEDDATMIAPDGRPKLTFISREEWDRDGYQWDSRGASVRRRWELSTYVDSI